MSDAHRTIVPVTDNEMIRCSRSHTLKSIQFQNFKSYAGSFDISPFPSDESLVCVVGPNGSGKSNLMDAVAFCFSCGDSTKLRGGGNLSNLICSTLVNDSVASVSVTLEAVHDPTQCVSFSRSISTRNESKYKLNNKLVTLETYRAEMVSCGLDVKGNFLVFQGDVEALALSTPDVLGSIVDRVSGSAEHVKDYDQLKSEKQALDSCLVIENAKKKRLTQEKKRLVTELEDVEKLRKLRVDRQTEQTLYYLTKLFVINSKIDHLVGLNSLTESDLHGALTGADAPSRQLTEAQSQLEELRSARAKAQLQVAKAERKLITGESDLKQSIAARNEREGKVGMLESKLVGISATLSEKMRVGAGLKEKLVGVDARIQSTESQLDSELVALDDLLSKGSNQDLHDATTVLPFFNSFSVDSGTARLRLDKLRKVDIPLKVVELDSELEQCRNELRFKQEALGVVDRRHGEIAGQLARNSMLEDDAARRVESGKRVVEEKQRELKSLRKAMDAAASKVSRVESKLAQLESEKAQLVEELCSVKESEQELVRESELRETVFQLTLSVGKEKVFGRFVDVIKPKEPKFGLALQTALGKYMDAVLVRDVAAATECVAWLKANRKGTLTLVPVNEVKVHANLIHSPQLNALDLVEVIFPQPTQIQRGIDFVLAGTLVCETLTEARGLAYGGSAGGAFVTISGQKIGRNGNITIGSWSASSRFDVKQVAAATKKIDALNAELLARRAELRQLEDGQVREAANFRRLEVETAEAEKSLAGWKLEFARLNESLASLASYVSVARGEMEKLQADLANTNSKLAQFQTAKETAVLEVCRSLLSELGILNYEQEILSLLAGTASKTEAFEEAKRTAKSQIAKTQTALGSLMAEKKLLELQIAEVSTVRDLQEEEVGLRKAIKGLKKDLEKLDSESRTIEARLVGLRDEVAAGEVSRSKCDARIKAGVETVGSLRKSALEWDSKKGQVIKEVALLRDEKVAILKQSVYDQILVPLTPENDSNTSSDEESRKIVEALFLSLAVSGGSTDGPSFDSLVDEVMGRVDFHRLPAETKRRATGMVKKEKAAQFLAEAEIRCSERLKEFEVQTEAICAIGFTKPSPDSLDRVERDLRACISAQETCRSELARVSSEHATLLEVRNKKFLTCFHYVSRKVNELYQLLTAYGSVSSGSSASLDLEAPASASSEIFKSGIIFSLMPPFKRYTNVELLSGGEKTVAAVALMFSLLSFANPPFSIVDEIDAALDSENVEVLAKFMREAVAHQLIVISLKEKLYARADCLIGVYKDPATRSSGIVTIDLREYPETAEEEVKLAGPQMTPGHSRSTRAILSGA